MLRECGCAGAFDDLGESADVVVVVVGGDDPDQIEAVQLPKQYLRLSGLRPLPRSPSSAFSAVDFPAPERPTRARTSPGATRRRM